MPGKKLGCAIFRSPAAMARQDSFEPVLSGKASAFFLSLPKRKQRRLFDLLSRLATYPSQPGD
jgi:hypothetical protein